MLIKKVKYTDYKGVEREDELYFNLNKIEITRMEVSHKGGLSEKIKRVVATQDAKEIMSIFEELIKSSYGKVSDDGIRFIKNPELVEEFVQTEAYSELFMELVTDADAASAFVEGIIPKVEQAEVKPQKQLK